MSRVYSRYLSLVTAGLIGGSLLVGALVSAPLAHAAVGPTMTGQPINGIVGQPYFFQFTSSADTTGCTKVSYNPPTGLIVSYDTTLHKCVLSGTPTTVQSAIGYGIDATNGTGTTNIFIVNETVTASGTVPMIFGNPPDMVLGTPYSFTFDTNAGNCVVASYAPPPGTTLSYSGGRCVLSGTPTAAGGGGFGINTTSGSNTTNLFILVTAGATAPVAPTISGTPPNTVVGAAYSYTFPTTNTVSSGFSANRFGCQVSVFQAGATALPAGLAVSYNSTSNTCILSGTATATGTVYFGVDATGVGGTVGLLTSITVVTPPTFTQSVKTRAFLLRGSTATYTVTLTNAGAAGSATIADTIPANVTVSGVTCTGTCSASYTGNVVTGTTSVAAGASQTFTITGTVTSGSLAPVIDTVTVTVSNTGCTLAACGGGPASAVSIYYG